jgi:signal transduction histidine kinase
MSADALLQLLTQTLYVAVFGVVVVGALRYRRRADVDVALLFGATALVVGQQWLAAALDLAPGSITRAITTGLVMALPYLLLRLVDDFAGVPKAILRGAEAGLAVALLLLGAFMPSPPRWLVLALVAYFVVLEGYCAARFALEARRSAGVTRRRMEAVVAGSVLLGLTILAAGLRAAVPPAAPAFGVISRLAGLGSGVAYLIGFATPGWLRRAWQDPELRAFLGRASSLPRLPDTSAIIAALEAGARASLGAPAAVIGLWDEERQALVFQPRDAEADEAGPFIVRPGQTIAGRAFAEGRAIFSDNAVRDDPEHAELYRQYGSTAVIAAPIMAGERRLGVLVAYAPRAPIFAEEDLELVQVLGDQAAVVLESRALIDEAARVRAREEATRLKDDFLSAAAHDLKTPLTTLIGRAQLLERQVKRTPDRPVDPQAVERIVREAIRLRDLVLEMLDAARAEQGRLVGERERVDLTEVARDVCVHSEEHRCTLEADGAVEGEFDRRRVTQLLENLVENAIKYSPPGTPVAVSVTQEQGQAHLVVRDRGIGIPAGDLPHIFERFYRAGNVDDRRYAGMGLGLYICRAIVEQHGGRIWAEPRPGGGTAFHVVLPLAPAAPERGGPAAMAGVQA